MSNAEALCATKPDWTLIFDAVKCHLNSRSQDGWVLARRMTPYEQLVLQRLKDTLVAHLQGQVEIYRANRRLMLRRERKVLDRLTWYANSVVHDPFFTPA